MSREEIEIIVIAAAWSGAVGVVGMVAAWTMRRWSLRWLSALTALVAVGALVAGVVGTARAMFLSAHDFEVVLRVSVVAGVVALASGLGVGSMIARSSRRLREQTQAFGETGRYVDDAAAPAELAAVSASLARTSERLRESRERELRLDESRRELVSWVSHDLRTPLAGLRAMAEALEDGMVEDPDRYHRQIRADVDVMVSLVEDLFEMSRLQAGLADRTRERLDVGDVVSEAIASAEPVARSAGVRLVGQADQSLVVEADPVGLARALSNLLANALRLTPSGQTVRIEARRADAGGTAISVTDACGGIEADDLARVFDLAWRGNPARTPDRDDRLGARPVPAGAGLGLAIVAGIVESHGGSVQVANTPPGCTFTVFLP